MQSFVKLFSSKGLEEVFLFKELYLKKKNYESE